MNIDPTLYTYSVVLERVVDGDTIVVTVDLGFGLSLNHKSVRLLEVDAPEIRGPGKEKGLAVKDLVINFLKDKKLILTSVDFDSFGRILGHVYYLEGEQWCSLNHTIIGFPEVSQYKK